VVWTNDHHQGMGNATPAIAKQQQPTAARTAPDARTRMVAARRFAFAAAILGTAYAAVSIMWGLGGSWLLDTVGGELAMGGRAGAPLVIFALWAAIVLKLIASALPLLAVSPAVNDKFRRPIRLLCGMEAVVLTAYGSVLTIAGILVHFGVIQSAADADHRAIAWHAFLWDPWFAAWGILVTIALLLSRPRA
jgi:Protein of unknown function (DUF3995)